MSKNNLDIQNEKELIKKLQEKGIFKNEVECLKCKNQINNLVIRNRNKGGNDLVSWRCKRCQAYKSVKENSFFSLFKKPVWFILTLIKYWCIQFHDSWSSYNKIQNLKGFKSMSVNHNYNFKDPETGALRIK
jgi:hypothetical protein